MGIRFLDQSGWSFLRQLRELLSINCWYEINVMLLRFRFIFLWPFLVGKWAWPQCWCLRVCSLISQPKSWPKSWVLLGHLLSQNRVPKLYDPGPPLKWLHKFWQVPLYKGKFHFYITGRFYWNYWKFTCNSCLIYYNFVYISGITDPGNPKNKKTFTFDHSYWSVNVSYYILWRYDKYYVMFCIILSCI